VLPFVLAFTSSYCGQSSFCHSLKLLYCIVLYDIVLYRTVLYCTVLYCIILSCTVLYLTCCNVLYCTYDIVQRCIQKFQHSTCKKEFAYLGC
jgi:hypothetical protein